MLSTRICGVNKEKINEKKEKWEIFIRHDGKSDKKRDKNKQTNKRRKFRGRNKFLECCETNSETRQFTEKVKMSCRN